MDPICDVPNFHHALGARLLELAIAGVVGDIQRLAVLMKLETIY